MHTLLSICNPQALCNDSATSLSKATRKPSILGLFLKLESQALVINSFTRTGQTSFTFGLSPHFITISRISFGVYIANGLSSAATSHNIIPNEYESAKKL